jgi:hypothetical protein
VVALLSAPPAVVVLLSVLELLELQAAMLIAIALVSSNALILFAFMFIMVPPYSNKSL